MHRKIQSKSFIFLLIVLLLFSLIGPVYAEDKPAFAASLPFDVEAEAALLMEADTGSILYEKNIDTPLPPASITKMMTLLLVFEAIEAGRASLDDVIVVSENAWRMQGSQMYLEIGQEVTLKELVQGISIISANDACVAVAEYLSGSEALFVQKMNEKARALGMTSTNFENSSGWPAAGHYMSARDIVILSREIIINHPEILKYESQREYTFNNIKQYNQNPLLGNYTGADGMKTGWTEEAGYCLAGTAVQNEMRLISVVLNTESKKKRLDISRQLLDYGFRNFKTKILLTPEDIAGEIPVKKGKKRTLQVTVASPLKTVLPANPEPEVELKIIGNNIEAPLAKGDVAGIVQVQVDGKVIRESELVAAENIARANIFLRGFRSIVDLIGIAFQRISRSLWNG
ncbi:MAG TPA: D-alanyl-D-alanine carboxypeptidase [Firmicutes bacterium]|nr:D-alanyl-D-alanine carboxypeptidase [Bacillota bacterium]